MMSRKLITSLASKPFIGAASMFGKSYAGSGPFFSLTTTRSAHAKVTLEQAQDMPRSYNELSNELIISAAIEGDQDAIEERLIREIMAVDGLNWDEAKPIFSEMVQENRKGLFMITLPYKVGVIAAVVSGVASLPMVFDYNTVLWFNEIYVTSDVPEAKDLETPLEVGSWAWNWMEPPLGQVSFFLLCMQFARSQLQNLDKKPYTEYIKVTRARRLCAAYPKYSSSIVTAFSKGDSLGGGN
jgi:hypothetical protein